MAKRDKCEPRLTDMHMFIRLHLRKEVLMKIIVRWLVEMSCVNDDRVAKRLVIISTATMAAVAIKHVISIHLVTSVVPSPFWLS